MERSAEVQEAGLIGKMAIFNNRKRRLETVKTEKHDNKSKQ